MRVAGLRELADTGNLTPGADGLSPAEQLVLINAEARRLMERQQATLDVLQKELEAVGIVLETGSTLDAADLAHCQEVFLAQVFPVLSPLAIDPAHPFPFIPNTGFSLALQLERKTDKTPIAGAFAGAGADRPLHLAAFGRRTPAFPANGRAIAVASQ